MTGQNDSGDKIAINTQNFQLKNKVKQLLFENSLKLEKAEENKDCIFIYVDC